MRYAYFPGCSSKGSCSELDQSMKLVSNRLGIELHELENAGCTGAREIRAINQDLHLAMNARILALAEREGCDLVVVCDTCLLNLAEVNHQLKQDSALRSRTNEALREVGYEYRGTIDVKHFLWVLLFDIGPQKLRQYVRRPLHGLRVAPFYGCHIVRPEALFGKNSGDHANTLEEFCAILGCEAVDYKGRTDCCGFHVAVSDEPIALKMSGSHIGNAADSGAHVMLTPCPLCHTVLDAFQPQIERKVNRKLRMPVLHLAQILGLAMGMDPKDLKIHQHMVPFQLEKILVSR